MASKRNHSKLNLASETTFRKKEKEKASVDSRVRDRYSSSSSRALQKQQRLTWQIQARNWDCKRSRLHWAYQLIWEIRRRDTIPLVDFKPERSKALLGFKFTSENVSLNLSLGPRKKERAEKKNLWSLNKSCHLTDEDSIWRTAWIRMGNQSFPEMTQTFSYSCHHCFDRSLKKQNKKCNKVLVLSQSFTVMKKGLLWKCFQQDWNQF